MRLSLHIEVQIGRGTDDEDPPHVADLSGSTTELAVDGGEQELRPGFLLPPDPGDRRR